MLPATQIIAFQHPDGGIGCHALCFSTPRHIRQHWEFVPQPDVLEAVLHAVDNYPPKYGMKVSDMTFLEPKAFSNLYQCVTSSDDLYRMSQLVGVPIRQWLADNGHYLTNVRPFYAMAEMDENAQWVINTDSITHDALQPPHEADGAKWVKVTHRGVQVVANKADAITQGNKQNVVTFFSQKKETSRPEY